MMIEDVRPEGCICELCSDISPNREDIRTKFGYTMLCAILLGALKNKNINTLFSNIIL